MNNDRVYKIDYTTGVRREPEDDGKRVAFVKGPSRAKARNRLIEHLLGDVRVGLADATSLSSVLSSYVNGKPTAPDTVVLIDDDDTPAETAAGKTGGDAAAADEPGRGDPFDATEFDRDA